MTVAERFIGNLDEMVAGLSASQRETVERLYAVHTSHGKLRAPDTMQDWVRQQFGELAAVESQKIVRVTNRVTLEDVLYNGLRARRPLQMRADPLFMDQISAPHGPDPLSNPLDGTPEDVFGRVWGQHSVTAANVAKLDGYSGVVVFNDYNPLSFNAEQVHDYFHAGWRWAQKAHATDSSAVYYLFMWNCLWRAGASLMHGHAQMLLGRHHHYGKVEALRRHALGYRTQTSRNYFDDLYAAHEALGLGFERDGVRVMAHLTPLKEKETLLIADPFADNLPAKVHAVLACFRDQLGVRSFNLALHQAPIGPVDEDWSEFPNVVRIVDRGDPHTQTSDMGTMELYAASVVASDPFRVADALAEAVR